MLKENKNNFIQQLFSPGLPSAAIIESTTTQLRICCNYVTWTILTVSLLRFWVRGHFSCIAVYAESESTQISTKNILICVPKMTDVLIGLEQHEGK